MAKKRRRLSVKMKRTLRITAAVLFLASAVGVALIPQKGAEAEGENPRVTLTKADSSIPVAKDGKNGNTPADTVYTTGDGVFQFCYLQKGTSENKVAVIVGYDYQRSLDGGTLRIPDTMNAYVKYTHSQGTEGGYVAVGRHGKPLYYPSKYKNYPEQKQVFEPNGDPKKDDEGNDVYETIDHYEIVGFSPCLYSNENVWMYELDYEGNPTNKLREDDNFYYRKDEKYGETVLENYARTEDQTTQRLKSAEVAYISNQHVEKETQRETREIIEFVYNDDGTKKEEIRKEIPFDIDVWTILENGVGEGIFSKAPNITTLITGSNLLGIGDYSFYNCANLRSITLGDGANTIGNYAFANCVNLKTADFPLNSSFSALGDHAFYNCRSLEEFTVPTFVQKIGDSAFEGCTGLKHIDLNAGGNEVLLNSLGDNVFRNCTSLEELVFPQFYSGETIGTDSGIFKLEWLEGCEKLKYIKIPNKSMQMESSTGMSHADFQKIVPKEFYFEGASDSRIHEISKNNNYAFKYLDEERYEKVEGVPNNEKKQTVYVVNDKNELIYFFMGEEVEEVNIPDAIGPYQIKVIGSDSFQGRCQLKSITIPASIEEIQPEAFMGCHNLKNVIFEENSRITKIGDKAFATQLADTVFHNSTTCGFDPTGIPELSFTGNAILGNPIFEYAMNPVNKINNSTQPTTYIKFYTGWPTNLLVQYNPTTDKNELIDYLSIGEINAGNIPRYPYMNTVLDTACSDAKKFLAGTITIASPEYTENVKNVIDNAYNPILPNGIESIKPGLFSGLDAEGNAIVGGMPDKELKTVTTNGLHKIDPYTFKGCTGLIGAYINGVTSELGDYAFEDCGELIDVDIHSDLTTFGLLPFKNCDKLTDVDFGTNPNFDCTEAIIFENNPTTHAKLLEVLESRGVNYGTGNVTVDEMKGVTEIRPESFKDCEGVMSVDFSQSTLTEIPESAFENTPDLYSVKLNNGIKAIRKNAFKDSGVRYLEIPNTLNVIDNSAFSNSTIDDAHRKSITFYCEEDSPAASYATNFPYIYVSEKPLTFKVCFYDEDGTTLLETLYVEAGQDAKPTVQPTKPGHTFKKWFPEPKNVLSDMNVFATYSSDSEVTFTVTFLDYDDTVLSLQTVKIGQDAITPVSPTREGYDFTGWRPAYTNVQSDITTYAQYEKQIPDNSESGSGGSSEKPSGGGSGNNPNGTGSSGQQLYTVIVKDGSGSGSYVAGATVVVAANDAPAGKAFDKWTVDNEEVKLASTSIAATTFVMPSSNVTITANYKDAKTPSGNNGSNSGTNSSNTGTTTKPNTTVSITKPGFSNENLASAVVSGSTDNFVLKITDSATAKKEVEDALEAQYGSTKNLKYLAMDISLYDSTGKNKIENKDDLKVTVTMPIPDELIPYAGNNRVAYVINGKLVELSPKFTTINGVSCISFVAPHFSPYTIYVDTTNLTAAGIQDYTPKTGDGISPKWFLAAALLCVSAFLFIKKDKKSVKVKAQ